MEAASANVIKRAFKQWFRQSVSRSDHAFEGEWDELYRFILMEIAEDNRRFAAARKGEPPTKA